MAVVEVILQHQVQVEQVVLEVEEQQEVFQVHILLQREHQEQQAQLILVEVVALVLGLTQ